MSTAMSKQQAELNLSSSSSSDKAQARTDSVEDSQQDDKQVHDLVAEQAHLAHQAAFLRRANTTLEKVIDDMKLLKQKAEVMALDYLSDNVIPEGEQLSNDQLIQSTKNVFIQLNEVAKMTSIILEKISSNTIQDTDKTTDTE